MSRVVGDFPTKNNTDCISRASDLLSLRQDRSRLELEEIYLSRNEQRHIPETEHLFEFQSRKETVLEPARVKKRHPDL